MSNIQQLMEPELNEQIEEQFFSQLKEYYKYYFPYKLFFRWLSYPSGNNIIQILNKDFEFKQDPLKENPSIVYMGKREFSFELKIDSGEAVYQRYQSFQYPNELMQRLNSFDIQKIDIGAIFNQRPVNKIKSELEAIEKEFVIDIDMTDYDGVRTCCQGAEICDKCWKFMKVASKILHEALTDDYGFKHILWVYSGRRGMHLWVCDQNARLMQNSLRKAIISYLSLVNDKTDEPLKLKLKDRDYYHPAFKRALKHIKNNFQKIILDDQQLLEKKPEARQKILEIIKSIANDLSSEIELEWSKKIKTYEREGITQYSQELWKILVEKKENYKPNTKQQQKYLSSKEKEVQCLDDVIMLVLLYPRLDANVSTTINHLLKAPFCIHPKSKRVCTPFTYEQAESFNPLKVPKLEDLVAKDVIKKLFENKVKNQTSQKAQPRSKSLKLTLNELIGDIMKNETNLNESQNKDLDMFIGMENGSQLQECFINFAQFILNYENEQREKNQQMFKQVESGKSW